MNKNINRRESLKVLGAMSMAASLPAQVALSNESLSDEKEKVVWGNLLHLSHNFWEDWDCPGKEIRSYRPSLHFDEKLWNDLLVKMADNRLNMVVIDLGDGVQYESHPEIAVKNAWSIDKLKAELTKIRELGMEPIPKLNFSASHDTWLGEYSKCLSTKKYYDVCSDLIAEMNEVFDSPRFFHLGMDEEGAANQVNYEYVAIRQHDLWWRDLYFLCDEVKKSGARPWVWSDYLWHNQDSFLEKMRKNVVQSNWYYGTNFDEAMKPVKAYKQLAEHGYDQIPTASNNTEKKSFALTVNHCRKNIQKEKLLGFLQTPWRPTIEEFRQHHMEAIEQVGSVIAAAK